MNAYDFLRDLSWHTLSEETRLRAKLSLLDLIGVGFSARGTDLSQIISAHARASFGGARPLLFQPGTASAPGIALAGGMTIDAIDAHDGWNPAKGHVGCGLFPALYALGPNASGKAFLTAFVAGYELGTRLSVTLHDTAGDYHTSGAWVAVAAALAGGHMAGLDQQTLAHAAGIAEYHGPRSPMMRVIDHPTMLKDGSGWGAMAGVSAVELARAGFTGAPAAILEGPHWANLGTRWYMEEQYIKNYPVCRWAQPPVEACLALQRAHGFAARDVAEIVITTFHESTRLATASPTTTEEAQYSTSFPIALALAHGKLGPEEVQGEFLFHPEVCRLSLATRMEEDDHANALFPGKRIARARIVLADGEVFESDWHEAQWDASAPATRGEIEEKFLEYTDGVPQAQRIIDVIETLERRPASDLYGLITG